MDGEVSLKDVYELVDNSRKETSEQLEKVNGNVTKNQVALGKLETKMEAKADLIDNNKDRLDGHDAELKTLSDKVHDQRVKAARIGGLAGVGVTAALRALEWVLTQVGA